MLFRSGSVTVAFTFRGVLHVGADTVSSLCTTAARRDLLLLRLDPSGKPGWRKQLPCLEPSAVARDPAGGDIFEVHVMRDVPRHFDVVRRHATVGGERLRRESGPEHHAVRRRITRCDPQRKRVGLETWCCADRPNLRGE